MTPELKKQIKEVQSDANDQSTEWWELISNDEDFTPWTDEDQSRIDEIVRQYDSIIDQLLKSDCK